MSADSLIYVLNAVSRVPSRVGGGFQVAGGDIYTAVADMPMFLKMFAHSKKTSLDSAPVGDSIVYLCKNLGNVPNRFLGAGGEAVRDIGGGFGRLACDVVQGGGGMLQQIWSFTTKTLFEATKLAAEWSFEAGKAFFMAYGPTVLVIVVVGGTVYLIYSKVKGSRVMRDS